MLIGRTGRTATSLIILAQGLKGLEGSIAISVVKAATSDDMRRAEKAEVEHRPAANGSWTLLAIGSNDEFGLPHALCGLEVNGRPCS